MKEQLKVVQLSLTPNTELDSVSKALSSSGLHSLYIEQQSSHCSPQEILLLCTGPLQKSLKSLTLKMAVGDKVLQQLLEGLPNLLSFCGYIEDLPSLQRKVSQIHLKSATSSESATQGR